MDGIHDLRGMSGFGAVEVEPDETTFHEPWESVAFGLKAFAIAVVEVPSDGARLRGGSSGK